MIIKDQTYYYKNLIKSYNTIAVGNILILRPYNKIYIVFKKLDIGLHFGGHHMRLLCWTKNGVFVHNFTDYITDYIEILK